MAVADLAPGQHADHVHDHWWWRPGWRVGRRFYAFHITFDNQPDLYRLVDAYQEALADLSTVTIVPREWLHVTMQGVGFTDEISQATAMRIVNEVRRSFMTIPAFTVEFGEIVVSDEAIVLPAQPPELIRSLRAATRDAIGRVLGNDQVADDPDRFRPHVSIAYIAADGAAAPYLTAVETVRTASVPVPITHIDLIEMHRDHRMYEWSTVARLPLPGQPTTNR